MNISRLLIALVGLGLFLAGWFSVVKQELPGSSRQSFDLYVRPVNGKVELNGDRLSGDNELGHYLVAKPVSGLQLTRAGWSESTSELPEDSELPRVVTMRCRPPQAKFAPTTQDGTSVELTDLPSEEKLEKKDGYYRLRPGPHEFLASAEGHLPQRLSVVLNPGEVSKLKVKLKPIPRPSLPVPVSPPPATSVAPPLRPRPSYRPPPARPRPRFTPVAPRPKPQPVEPRPMFTPLP